MLPLYEPQEDSYLLAKHVKKHAKGIVLDIGTGTGIQALSSLENKKVRKVIGVDISKSAIEYCKKNIKNKKAEFIISDLFTYFHRKSPNKFDTIIFNPPYLPSELKLRDLTTEGGKNGYETIVRFLSDANNFLNPNGNILLVFSSLTNKEKIAEIISNNLLEYIALDTRHMFFEEIYVYLIRKSSLLKNLEHRGIRNIKYFTKGKHGIIYQGILNRKMVAIKLENPNSKALNKISKEARLLRTLNNHRIGPKLLLSSEKFFVSEFIHGKFIYDYIRNNEDKQIKLLIKKIFTQLFLLDKLCISKEEMHRPIKHIILRGHSPVLIDFERAHYTEKPKNITQFCEFIMRSKRLLMEKGITINQANLIDFAKKYRHKQTKNLKEAYILFQQGFLKKHT